MTKICEATRQHIRDLVNLNDVVHKIHAKEYPDIFKDPTDPDSVSTFFEELIQNPSHYIFLAIEDGKALGYIWAQYMEGSESALKHATKQFYIHHIAVREDNRGKRIGVELMSRIEELAQYKDVAQIALDVWSFNSDAQEFFKHQFSSSVTFP